MGSNNPLNNLFYISIHQRYQAKSKTTSIEFYEPKNKQRLVIVQSWWYEYLEHILVKNAANLNTYNHTTRLLKIYYIFEDL